MAEFTDDDVTRLAGILARDGVRWMSEISLATYLVRGEGVTLPPPPPDPAVVVTKEIAARVWPDMGWGPVDLYPVHADLAAAVRDLFPVDVLEAAAAMHDDRRTEGLRPWPPTWAMYGRMWEERDKATREVDRLRAALDLIASSGCGLGGPDRADPVGPWTTCRTHEPDRGEWCWSCIAADALEADRG